MPHVIQITNKRASGTGHKKPVRVPSPFEVAVYTVTKQIPKGQTRSYRWVAEQLGDAGLARAVGNALNRNPCLRRACTCCTRRGRQAYVPRVPCHRVIKSDGTLGGYAKGLAKKRALLAREGWKPLASSSSVR